MNYFTTKENPLFYCYELNSELREKIYKFLHFLDVSKVAELFPEYKSYSEKGGRPPYSYHDLFATIVFGFAFGDRSLRELESACTYDLRFMYLMNNETPSHTSFENFINNVISPNANEIFYRITKTIIDEINLDISDCFIDGTKFEADANKYKFVWKPTTFHIKLSAKILDLLKSINLERGVPKEEIISSEIIANKLTEISRLINECEDNLLKSSLENKYKELFNYLSKVIEYEEKEEICGPDRNSYYKTDHSATAMCLKEDYYSGLGSNMHAAYNVQILVSKGIVLEYLISSSKADFKDFIPILDKFNEYYGYYPKRVCADAGYGSYENYVYLYKHNIENYVKYTNWQGNVSARNPDKVRINENGQVVCLNDKIGNPLLSYKVHHKKSNTVFYEFKGCRTCDIKEFCKKYLSNKSQNNRMFEINMDLLKYKCEVNKNLLSPKGIELRVNRSSQVEGVFGVVKQDMAYERLTRTTKEKVDTELMLIFLGYNIRKLFRYFDGKAKFDYWVAPDNLSPEKFKKISHKRLVNKALRKRKLSANEKSKREYKRKRS